MDARAQASAKSLAKAGFHGACEDNVSAG